MNNLVRLRRPGGIEGFQREVVMSTVPRVGEAVHIEDDVYRVQVVAWYPFGDRTSPAPFVMVVIK